MYVMEVDTHVILVHIIVNMETWTVYYHYHINEVYSPKIQQNCNCTGNVKPIARLRQQGHLSTSIYYNHLDLLLLLL